MLNNANIDFEIPLSQRLAIISLIAFCVAFSVFIFAPLEIYLTNIESFDFSLKDMIFTILMLFVGAFVLMVLVGILLKNKLFYLYLALLVGAGIAFYIQGNWLNNTYGILDGNPIDWSSFTMRGIISIAIWVLCFILPILIVLFSGRSKNLLLMPTLAVAGVQVITLVFLFLTINTAKPATGRYFVGDENFHMSKNDNIIVFILDAYDTTIFQSQLANKTKHVTELKDFVYYDNNSGIYSTSEGSLPFMMTGVKTYNEEPYKEYKQKVYVDSELFPFFAKNGYDVTLYSDRRYLPNDPPAVIDNIKEMEVAVKSKFKLTAYFYSFTLYRYAPQPLKPLFERYYDSIFSRQIKPAADEKHLVYSNANLNFYKMLKNDSLWSLSDVNKYKFYYIHGAHMPYLTDENLKEVGDSTAEKQAEGVLKLVGEYLNKLKEMGIYDSSTIILTADHGVRGVGMRHRPVLLIKQAGSTHDEMVIDSRPVSMEDFPQALMKAANKEEELFPTREERHYYYMVAQLSGGYYNDIYEYAISSDVSDIKKTGRVFGKDGLRIEPIKAFEISKPYKFTLSAETYDFFEYGIFSKNEPDVKDYGYLSEASIMRFSLPEGYDNGKGVKITINYKELNGSKQDIIVSSKGEILLEDSYSTPDGTISFTVPPQCIDSDNTISVLIKCPNATYGFLAPTTKTQGIYAFKLTEIIFGG